MRKRKLPKTAVAVLHILHQRADDLGAATVSRSQLARWIGCSEVGARKSIRRLEADGLLEVEHNCGLSGKILTNTYYLRREG